MVSTCTLNFDKTHLSLNDYSNEIFNVLDGRYSTEAQESGPIYTYVKDFNSENSSNTYAVHTNKMVTHTRCISAHSCSLVPLKEDIMEENKEVPTKFLTNIGKGKKRRGKVKAEKQFYENGNLLSSATNTDNLCLVTWSDVKFPSRPRQTMPKIFLKDRSTDKIVNDTLSIKYVREISNPDDDEIISDNSSLKYVREFSNADDNKILSDISLVNDNREDSSSTNSSCIKFSPRQCASNEILKKFYTKGIVRDTSSIKYIKITSTTDNYEILSDSSLIKNVTEYSNADDNEIVSDTFSVQSIRNLCSDNNEIISSSYSVKSVGELSKDKFTDMYDTPKRIYLKQLDDRRKTKRIPIRMANLPRKMYTRDKNEVRITKEDIQIVEPNSDSETFDINKFLRKTRRILNFSLDDIDEKNSETSTYITVKEDTNVMNGLNEISDLEKPTMTKNNKNSKHKSKPLENFLSELSGTSSLERSMVTKNNKNSKHKLNPMVNFLSGLSETSILEKSTITKNNNNLNQESKALENSDKKFFFEGYIDKLKDIARKPPITKRAKEFEEKTYPKVYFDFDDYCVKIFNLKEKFSEKQNKNNKKD